MADPTWMRGERGGGRLRKSTRVLMGRRRSSVLCSLANNTGDKNTVGARMNGRTQENENGRQRPCAGQVSHGLPGGWADVEAGGRDAMVPSPLGRTSWLGTCRRPGAVGGSTYPRLPSSQEAVWPCFEVTCPWPLIGAEAQQRGEVPRMEQLF